MLRGPLGQCGHPAVPGSRVKVVGRTERLPSKPSVSQGGWKHKEKIELG